MVIKRITSFDKKKSIWKECNSRKVRCEYCSSIFRFSRLKCHIKRFLEDIVLPSSVDSIRETASQINGIKPVNEFIESEFLEDQGNSIHIDIDKLLEE